MLRSYIRKWRNRRHDPPFDWIAAAFHDVAALDGDSAAMLRRVQTQVAQAAIGFDAFTARGGSAIDLARKLTDASARIDDGKVWHRDGRLRSYVDVSLQAKALRVIVDYLAIQSVHSVPMEPLELTSLVLEHLPSNRAALIAHAELLLERRELDAAIETIERALRIQAVCTTAQQMLDRAQRMKGVAGEGAFELSEHFCDVPFTQLSTGYQGEAFACFCPAWVPYPVGNVFQAESADAIWNSPKTMEIRRSILDGDYSYCSRTLCAAIGAQRLPKKSAVTDPVMRRYIDERVTRIDELPGVVHLNHDPTCNLACPSCRTEVIASKADEQDAYAHAAERVILPLLKKVNGHTYITGGGEAFASKHFRSILKALNRDEYPGLYVLLITNGTLLTPVRWNDFPDLPEMIDVLLVSLDAARKDTFERLRAPAKWDVVMKNVEHMMELRRAGEIRNVTLNFVAQKDNFRELHDFVILGRRLGADQFWLQRLTNYGSYDEATFADIDVTSPAHPDHAELLEILRHPMLQEADVVNMLVAVLPEAVGADDRLHTLIPAQRKERNVSTTARP
jgi:wyosine [tRNA(Phe)-imidazoG37] synthetase (radical SAM superfamily)